MSNSSHRSNSVSSWDSGHKGNGHGDDKIGRSPRGDDGARNQNSGVGETVYVSNLAYDTQEVDIRTLMSKYGEVSSIDVIRDPATQQSRGFAFVHMCSKSEADKAIQELAGTELLGRIIRLEVSRRKQGYDKTPGRYMGPEANRRTERPDNSRSYRDNENDRRDDRRGNDYPSGRRYEDNSTSDRRRSDDYHDNRRDDDVDNRRSRRDDDDQRDDRRRRRSRSRDRRTSRR